MTTGSLVWTAPTGVIAAAVVIGLLSLALAWRRDADRRVVEMALWIPVVLGVVIAAAGPVWVVEGKRMEQPRLVVLVDDSRSMGVLEKGGPRSDQVQDALDRLGDEHRVERFTFDSALHTGGEPKFQASDSDLGTALQAIQERFAGEKLAGVVVITDGIDRGAMGRVLREEGTLTVPRLPGPLTLYQVGSQGAVRDLALAALQTGDFAFVRTPFTVTVDIEGPGFENRKVPVTLTRDGALVAKLDAQLDEQGLGQVTFRVTPTRPGRFSYEAAVPIYDGDAVPGNNSMAVVVRVVRDRLRILQVCGAPSFDQKFLRLFLKQDPAVDLVSFFILRTNEDLHGPQDYSPRELSLIEFPYERLFSEDLWTFDLVVFQNFDYAPYFRYRSDELLGNLAEYVTSGNALVMIGGDRSFDLGEYAGTPLADVLPVRLGVGGNPVDLAAFKPSLTSQGEHHPVTRLVGDPMENDELWARLSPLDGLNLNNGLAHGSAALLTHPTLKTPNGRSLPVLAVREVGRGRTMALMGDSSWRWVMAESARGHGNQAYLRFWKNAIRWLIRDPSGEPIQVEAGRENALPGETLRLVVRVTDVGFDSVPDALVTLTVQGPQETVVNELTTDQNGEAVLEFLAKDHGAHKVKAQVRSISGTGLGTGSTVFAVTSRDPELEDVVPNQALLAALALATEGLHYLPGDYGPPKIDREAGRWVTERTEDPLWAVAWLPLLVGLLGSLAWWVRRRSGGR
jgi:uncharacterized membrane protein